MSSQAMTNGALTDRAHGAAVEIDLDGAPEFLAELTSRNVDILSPEEQRALCATKILVAGCGTVGGSVVEPLARLGVADFVLADPDVFDVTNLNRQACYLSDVGRPKPDVLQDRVRQVNPLARAQVLNEGLTPENLCDALEGVTVVFDGVDAFTSLWVKYLIHDQASRRGIPVIAGSDYGGKPTLYVFDYRRDPRPFYGKGSEEHHRAGRHQQALRWLGVLPIPTDFLPVIGDRMTTGAPWPQIVYCALGMGAAGSRAVIDVAVGRRVPHVIAIDLHMLVRGRRDRWRERLRWPRIALRTRIQVDRVRRRGGTPEPPTEPARLLPARLLAVAEAIRVAPSLRNTQPWRLATTGPGELLIECVDERLLGATDPGGGGLLQSLGCAIEAARMVAEVEFAHAAGRNPLTNGLHAGTLSIGPLHDDYARTTGLLQWRQTNRGPFARARLDVAQLSGFADIAANHDVEFATLTDQAQIKPCARHITSAMLSATRAEGYVEEALRWVRLSSHDGEWPFAGCAVSSLGFGSPGRAALRAVRVDATLRALAGSFALRRVLACESVAHLDRCGALVALIAEDTPRGHVATGRALMAIWIAATRAGLAVQPLFVPGVSAGAPIAAAFGCTGGREPRLLIRLGRAPRAAQCPRLPLHEVVAVKADAR